MIPTHRRCLVRLTGIALALALATFPATAADQARAAEPEINYTVTVSQPQLHLFAVRMEISGSSVAELDVSMPVWTPGSYLVREYERHVTGFAASDGEGRALAWRKVDKNTWRISANGAREVVVEYEVYAREPGIRWSFLYDEGGHVIGPSLFMYLVGSANQPATASFELPDGWRMNGAIAPSGDNPYLISADSYHELIDAPMLIGAFDEIEFEVQGIPHLIAILGPHNADLVRLRDEFTRIVEACSELFGGLPYERYAFVFTTLTGGGGIEHADGTTIGLSGLDFQSESGHRAVLGVTSHEFFHAWVVKRIQPPAFRPYDYEGENYTDALWFFEGFTSYYADRILHRAGLIDELEDPTGVVRRYRSTPGLTMQSAADASFNAWIHLYRSDESFNSYRTDYYFKGSVIANLLELVIADRTHGEKGVDDVMQLIWQRTRDEGASFDSEAIRAACEEVAGGSFREFFDSFVFSAEDIPFEEFFRLAGYELVVDEAATRQANTTGYIGVYLGEEDGRARLDGIVRGGPAWRHGLNYDDQILAVDGVEVGGLESLREAISGHAPGEEVELLISRHGKERLITVTLGQRVPVYEIVEVDEPSSDQLAVRRVWRQTRE